MRPAVLPRRRPALLLVLLAGCSVDLQLPGGAQVTCASDAECPGGWVCPATLHKCVQAGGDMIAPALVPGSLVVTPTRVGLSTTTVTFGFQVTEGLAADPQVSIRLADPATPTRTLALVGKSPTTHQYVYAYDPVSGTDPEGEVAFVARFVDLAGNEGRVDLPAVATFDFTPPALAVDATNVPVKSVMLTPPHASPLAFVTAITFGSRVRVDFAAAEMLDAAHPPTVRLADGNGTTLALAQVSGNGLSYVYDAVVGSTALQDGPASLTAHLTDLAGNTADVSLGTVQVKLTPPTSPAVGTANAILFHRIPWGSETTGGAEAFYLRGLAGSVPPNSVVIAYSDPLVVDTIGSPVGREIGRTAADATGAFGGDVGSPTPFQLYMGDSPDVYVAAVDAAGNISDADAAAKGVQAALVRDVAWTATMAGKIQGRTFPNPHQFEGRQVWTSTLAQYGATPVATPADVGRQDGVRASVRGAPHWLPTRTYGPLGFRDDVGMAYDPVRGCRVAFGGQSWDGCDAGFYCSQWESCRGGAWQMPAVSDPEGDGNPSLGYELPLVFAGGRGMSILSDGTDLWEWNGASWRRLVMSDPEGDGNPAPRTGHAIAYDEARQRLLLFGGAAVPGGALLGDTWETDFKSWKRVCTTAPCSATMPAARSAHSMVYDPARKVTLLVGGRISSTPTYDSITWTWNGAAGTWAPLCTSGTCLASSPAAREQTALALDRGRNVAVLFGGWKSGTGYDGGTYEWNGTTWSVRCTSCGPTARANHSMFYDPDRVRSVLFGGQVGSFGVGECPGNFCGTEWEWNGATWTQVLATPAGPPSVSGVTPVYDSFRNQVVLFGGQTGGGYSSATYLWDGIQWVLQSPVTVPAARANYAASWTTSYGWLVGGEDAGGPMASAYWWSGSNWFSYAGPTARTQSAMTMSPRRLNGATPIVDGAVLFGGRDATLAKVCDTWEYISPSWTQVRNNACGTGVDPAARYGHAMVQAAMGPNFATTTVVMFGGVANGPGNGTVNDVWNWTGSGTGSWTLVSADGTPSATKPRRRTDAGLLFDTARSRVLMFGGSYGPAVSNVNCVDNYGGLPCHDFWEWSGAAWTRVWPVDLYGDGTPTPGRLEGMAYDTTRKLGVGLESGGTTLQTWWWYGGGTDRPGEVMSVTFDAAQVLRPFDVLDLQVTWVGGASGAPAGTTTNGASVQLWDNTAWRTIASSAIASPTSPATLSWTLLGDATYGGPTPIPASERRRFLVGDGKMLYLGLVPGAASGSADGMGEVATDYAEVTVRYQLGP